MCVARCANPSGDTTLSQEGDLYNTEDYVRIEDFLISGLQSRGFTEVKIYDSSELSAGVLNSRNDTVVIERCVGIVTNNTNGDTHGVLLNGVEGQGNYISYRNYSGSVPIDNGTIIISYMVYNPDNNYIDDIVERYDFVVSENGEVLG